MWFYLFMIWLRRRCFQKLLLVWNFLCIKRQIPLAILLYEQFKHLTQITLRLNTQLLSNQQHAYRSFLSHFLVLFRHSRWILDKKCYYEQELQYIKVFWPKCMYISGIIYNFWFLPWKIHKRNCKNTFFYQKFVYLGESTLTCSRIIVVHFHANVFL